MGCFQYVSFLFFLIGISLAKSHAHSLTLTLSGSPVVVCYKVVAHCAGFIVEGGPWTEAWQNPPTGRTS